MFRALFVTFFAGPKADARHSKPEEHTSGAHHPPHESPKVMTVPLMILGFLALVGGYIGIGDRFEHFLDPIFDTGVPALPIHPVAGGEWTVTAISVTVALLGLATAWLFYIKNPELPERMAKSMRAVYELVWNKYWIDELYGAVITRPLRAFSRVVLWRVVDVTLIDGTVNGVGSTARGAGNGLRQQASGQIRSYATWVALGAAAVLLYMYFGGPRA
jgi:NADH-quinone oxidoreductase subunit L